MCVRHCFINRRLGQRIDVVAVLLYWISRYEYRTLTVRASSTSRLLSLHNSSFVSSHFFSIAWSNKKNLTMSLEVSSFSFLELIECLKNIRRSDWIRRDVSEFLKIVFDYMYRMTIMCRMISEVQLKLSDTILFALMFFSLMRWRERQLNVWSWFTIWEKQWLKILRPSTR